MDHISSYKGGRWTACFISNDRRRRLLFLLGAAAAAVWLGGCASQELSQDRPIVREPQRVQLPQTGELEVHADAMPLVGNVIPVKLSVKNLAPRSRVLDKPAVRAITVSGERVNELGLDDPAVVENGSELLRVVSNGQSAMGAVVEKDFGGWGAIGFISLLGAGPVLMAMVAIDSVAEAAKNPSQRLRRYSLGDPASGAFGEEPRYPTNLVVGQISISGYVFLANQKYTALEVTVINTLTGNDEVLTVPWNNAADLAESHRKGSSR